MVNIGSLSFLSPPIMLAPMEDVSDPPFRHICKLLGADLMYTEFISSEGLIRNAIRSKKKLDIYDEERPIGVQIFGGDEEAMGLSAEIVNATNPDIIDINFGCPVKKVVCKGAGASVLKDLPLMQRLTDAVARKATVPVTAKTRLGWDSQSINVIEAAQRLQDVGIKALTVHARTRAQMYRGRADWRWIRAIKEHPAIRIPIFGNGDINSPIKAKNYMEESGVDGIMIGRAAIGNPWIFKEIKHFLATGNLLPSPSLAERIAVLKLHLQKSISWKGENTGIREMRKHYANYLKGIPHIKHFRKQLVVAPSQEQILDILDNVVNSYENYSIPI